MKNRKIRFIARGVIVAMIILYGVTALWLSYNPRIIKKENRSSSATTRSGIKDCPELLLTPEVVRLICEEECGLDYCLRNKEIAVSGTVLRKNTAIDKGSYLVLKVGQQENIGCYMKQQSANIKQGDTVRLKGIYKQYAMENIVIVDGEQL